MSLVWQYLGEVEVEGPGQQRQYHRGSHHQHSHQQGRGENEAFTWHFVRTIVHQVVIIDANLRENLSSA